MSRISSTFHKNSSLRSVQKPIEARLSNDMSFERISEPLGNQTSAVLEWSNSLRDRGHTRSRSPSPVGPGRRHSFKGSMSLDMSQSFKKSDSLKKSTGLAASFGSTNGKLNKSTQDLHHIEAEYIKNLQQQIYFLELETGYLRDQAKKATDMHPQMTAEAERMLMKLRQMHSEIEDLQLELRRRESSIVVINSEKDHLVEQLKREEDSHVKDKRLYTDEIVQVRKNRDQLDAQMTRKDGQLMEAKNELDKSATALKNAEVQIQSLRCQLDQRVEQHKMTQLALEEKRTELLATETQLRDLEDKYYSSPASMKDRADQDFRDEIRLLRQKLKETEMNAEQDRYLRSKLSDDTSNVVKENATLNQQILELRKQLDREQNLRENTDERRAQNISEFVCMKDRERSMTFDLTHIQEQLKMEQEKVRHYTEQLVNNESEKGSYELQMNTTRSKFLEVESHNQILDTENTQLRKDKYLLVDHVADLQRKIKEKEQEVLELHVHIDSTQSRLKDVEHLKTMEHTVQSQKWEEFGKLAESMRSLSQSMAKTSTSRVNKIHQY